MRNLCQEKNESRILNTTNLLFGRLNKNLTLKEFLKIKYSRKNTNDMNFKERLKD